MHDQHPDADLDALRAKAAALATWTSSEAFHTRRAFQRIAVDLLSQEAAPQGGAITHHQETTKRAD